MSLFNMFIDQRGFVPLYKNSWKMKNKRLGINYNEGSDDAFYTMHVELKSRLCQTWLSLTLECSITIIINHGLECLIYLSL